jgi:hypothetical protein
VVMIAAESFSLSGVAFFGSPRIHRESREVDGVFSNAVSASLLLMGYFLLRG